MTSLFLNKEVIKPPGNNEIEITLFGPSYGESVILKLPNVGWFVIDSCRFTSDNLTINPALEYLKSQNVESLKAVILTHPHEDHYLGLAEIIREYKGRIGFICKYAADGLLAYKTYVTQQHIAKIRNINEFVDVVKAFKEAEDEGAWPKRLGELTPIIDEPSKGIKLISLTPSSKSIDRYTEHLNEGIAQIGEAVFAIKDKTHNLIASAIWISIGSVRIILGSDLEKGGKGTTGWSGVLANPGKPDLSVNSIKVSHHGSSGAFHRDAWEKHKANGLPISILTPCKKGATLLPQDSGINRLKEFSSHVGITSRINHSAPKKVYSREILRATKNDILNWRVIEPQKELGLLRIRLDGNGKASELTAIPPAHWC